MELSAGGAHFLALLEGEAYTWGGNEYGQLGDQDEVVRPRPMLVMREVIAVACGWYHSLIITQNHELLTWGSNGSGQLGNGTQGDRSMPVHVLDNVLAAAGGDRHSLAVVDSPGLQETECYAWGAYVGEGINEVDNITGVGQLVLEPTKMQHLRNACRLSAGRNHSLVITKGGDLFSWGRNRYGQLGNGTSMNGLVPARVMESVRAAAAGMDFSVAATRQGECFAWGRNRNGQVGDGSTLDRFSPVKILDGVRTMAAGQCHTLAVLGNGECVTWGRNLYECVCSGYEWGRPGDVRTPIRVLEDVSAVIAAESQSIALLKNGEYQVWGRNWSGITQSLSALGSMAYLRRPPMGGPNLGDLSHVEVEDDEFVWEPEKEVVAREMDPEIYAAYFAKKQAFKAEDEPNQKACAPDSDPSDEEAEVELSREEALKIYKAEDDAWLQGPVQKHGDRVHVHVHSRSLALGRPYALRWAAFRRRRVQELMAAGASAGGGETARDVKTPGGSVKKTVTLPRHAQLATDLQRDEQILQLFHGQMWKDIFRYKKEKKASKGDDAFVKSWPAQDHDIHHGLEALEKSLRAASKATLKTEELFSTPPLTPRSKKEATNKNKRKARRFSN